MSSEAEQGGYQVNDLDLSHQDNILTPQSTHPAAAAAPLPPPLPHSTPPPPLPHSASPSRSTLAVSPLPPPSQQPGILQCFNDEDRDPSPRDLDLQLSPISSAMNALKAVPGADSTSSWAGPRHPASPGVSGLEVPVEHRASLATKAEPDLYQMKSELLDRLKREIQGASSVKGGQEVLMMTSFAKTSADDRASQVMLQLAGQNVDLKEFPKTRVMPAALERSAPGPSSSVTETTSGSSVTDRCSTHGKGELTSESEDSMPKKIRHKKRVNGNKICLVCGDKALAHNFDVITCESCKAFFRRNALKSQTLQHCMFQSNCTIDKNTRRFCPSCRLKKCFTIGMKAELMLDEGERRLRQEKKAQRVRQRLSGNSSSSTTTSTPDGGQFLEESPHTDPMDTDTSCDPGSSTPTLLNPCVSPFDSSQQGSSVQPSSLPSFQALKDPTRQSPSTAGHSSPHSHSSSLGVSPGMTPSQPASPFSSLLTQLSTSSSSPVPFTSSALSGTQPNSGSSLPQPQAAYGTGSSGFGQSSSAESSSQKNQLQGPEDEKQQRREDESLSRFLEPTPSLTVENASYPLPGPAARIFKHVPRDQLPSDPFMYWVMSPEERLMLANLTNAYQEVLLSLQERSVCRNMPLSESYFIHDFLNEIDDAMYKIVQFSKHIADFRQMRKEDQIAMLKSSAMHTFGVACCAAYVHERDCWLSLRGDLTSSHLRKLTNDDPYIQVGVEYCRSVKSLVKNDLTVYALIHCMILFDPRDAKILDRQVINQTRDKYVIILKHYLESQHSYLFADEYFVAIQERVREMFHLAKTGNAMFKRYSSAFQPLITEMLSST